jgi:hypothetical protein
MANKFSVEFWLFLNTTLVLAVACELMAAAWGKGMSLDTGLRGNLQSSLRLRHDSEAVG